MKKALSLILALVLTMGYSMITLTADNNTTTITAVVPERVVSFDMVIPESVSIDSAGIKEIGAPTVEKVKNASVNTVISYTATGTDFTMTGKPTKTMKATYYTDADGINALDSKPIKVYEQNAAVNSLTRLYVSITEKAWNAAEAGIYTATVTFAFSSSEVVTVSGLLSTVSGGFPTRNSAGSAVPANAWKCDGGQSMYVFGDTLFAGEDSVLLTGVLENKNDVYVLDASYGDDDTFITWEFNINPSGELSSVTYTYEKDSTLEFIKQCYVAP